MHEYMKRKLEFGVTILPDPNSSPNKVSRFNESAQIDNRTDIESDIANRAQVTTINYIPCATFSANLTSALRKEGKGKKPRNIHTYIQQPCRKRKPNQDNKGKGSETISIVHVTNRRTCREKQSTGVKNPTTVHNNTWKTFKWRRKKAAEIKQRSTVESGLLTGGQNTREEKHEHHDGRKEQHNARNKVGSCNPNCAKSETTGSGP
jgi:hypothetical protein